MIARAHLVDRGQEPREDHCVHLPGVDLPELAGFLDRPTASQAIRDYRATLRGE
jgi:hypothetical protein